MQSRFETQAVASAPARFANPKFVLIIGLCATLLTGIGIVAAIWAGKETAENEWKSRLSAFTTMLSAHTRQSIGAADLVLRNIADNVNELGVTDQESLRRAFGNRKTFDMLRDTTRGVPQIDVATIVALNGDVINFTRSFPPPPINLADRDYFKAHLENPGLEVFLSVPVQNRGNGGWTFYLARKIRGPSGEMVGLVLTGLFTSYFSDFYRSISVGLDHSISLYRDDGRMIARFPERPASFGKSFLKFPVFQEGLKGEQDGVAITEMPRGTDPKNSDRRMVAARKTPDYPLVVGTTATDALYLSQWWGNAKFLAIIGALMCLVLASSTAILVLIVRKLEVARMRALQAVEAKSRFVSTVSHELRTPMSSIISGSSQLMDFNLGAEPLKLAVLVSRSAKHLLVLINDILDFARFETGTERVTLENFNVREILENVLEIAKSLPHAGSLDIKMHIAPDLPNSIGGDKARLTQILLNLLGNAVKYTPAGEVKLSAHYRDGVLNLRVSDTGIGISSEEQARIFEPFERGASHSKDISGTGLGLTICKRLTSLLGGTISVQSRVGEGSIFDVALPMPPSVPSTFSSPSAAPGDRSRTAKILVAEDSPAVRTLITMQLRKENFDVRIASNGREAVDNVRSEPPDYILMDVQMPEMDGIEATRAIRLLPPPACKVPIYAITAFADELSQQKALDAGVNLVLNKPLDVQQLKRLTQGSGSAKTAAVEDRAALNESLHRNFIRDLRQSLEEIRTALRRDDHSDLQRACHRLNGAFSSFGYPELQEMAARAERDSSDLQSIELLLQTTARLLDHLEQATPSRRAV